jgi:hypothetical protein
LILIGQLEYNTIHQHFLHNDSIFVIVVSIDRDDIPLQLKFWASVLFRHCSEPIKLVDVIVVVTKIDLIKSSLSMKKKECVAATTTIGFPQPIFLSSLDINIKSFNKLKAAVSKKAQEIVSRVMELPTSFVKSYSIIDNIKHQFLWRDLSTPKSILSFWNKTGCILFFDKSCK